MIMKHMNWMKLPLVRDAVEKGDEGWWKGDLDGKIGIFPANVSLSIKKSLFRHVSIINQIIIISFIVR